MVGAEGLLVIEQQRDVARNKELVETYGGSVDSHAPSPSGELPEIAGGS